MVSMPTLALFNTLVDNNTSIGGGRMPYTCSVCGRTFDKGAFILDDGKVLCPSCKAEYLELLDSIAVDTLLEYLNTGKTPDVDKIIAKHTDKIKKLKLSEVRLKRYALTVVLSQRRA